MKRITATFVGTAALALACAAMVVAQPQTDEPVSQPPAQSSNTLFATQAPSAAAPARPGNPLDVSVSAPGQPSQQRQVSAAAAPESSLQARLASQARGAPHELKIFRLNNASAERLAAALAELFDPAALTLVAEPDSNSIIIRGDKETLAEVEAILLGLDQPPPKSFEKQITPQSPSRFEGGGGLPGPAALPNPRSVPAPPGATYRGAQSPQSALAPEYPPATGWIQLRSQRGETTASVDAVGGSMRLSVQQIQDVAELRRQYQELEAEAERLAAEYRTAVESLKDLPPGSYTLSFKTQRDALQTAVQRAFEARQRLQSAEAAQLRQRLASVEDSIATRDKLKDEIINRRVSELIKSDPLRWEPASGASPVESQQAASDSAAPPGAASQSSSFAAQMRSALGGGSTSGGEAIGEAFANRRAQQFASDPANSLVWVEFVFASPQQEGRPARREAIYRQGAAVSSDGLVAVALETDATWDELAKVFERATVHFSWGASAQSRLMACDEKTGAAILKVELDEEVAANLRLSGNAPAEGQRLTLWQYASVPPGERSERGASATAASVEVVETEADQEDRGLFALSNEHGTAERGAMLVATDGALAGIVSPEQQRIEPPEPPRGATESAGLTSHDTFDDMPPRDSIRSLAIPASTIARLIDEAREELAETDLPIEAGATATAAEPAGADLPLEAGATLPARD